MGSNDLVIGVFTSNYTWEDIEPWVVSLDRSGYKGNKSVLIVGQWSYESVNQDISKKLHKYGFTIGLSPLSSSKSSFMVERFFHVWNYLRNLDGPVGNVIVTDVKDVIFQYDPSTFFDPIGTGIVVSGEGLKYRDEPWSRENLANSFGNLTKPHFYDNEIICAGVIGGEFNLMKDLMLQIYAICQLSPYKNSTVPGGGGPDQAALNVLLNQLVWFNNTLFTNADDNFCLHAGTTQAAMYAGSGQIGHDFVNGRFDPSSVTWMAKEPLFENGELKTSEGVPYKIVHQYNRIPEWNSIAEKYRE